VRSWDRFFRASLRDYPRQIKEESATLLHDRHSLMARLVPRDRQMNSSSFPDCFPYRISWSYESDVERTHEAHRTHHFLIQLMRVAMLYYVESLLSNIRAAGCEV
jgi:hypothetical protein